MNLLNSTIIIEIINQSLHAVLSHRIPPGASALRSGRDTAARADRVGQEVWHRNSMENPVIFQNKTSQIWTNQQNCAGKTLTLFWKAPGGG